MCEGIRVCRPGMTLFCQSSPCLFCDLVVLCVVASAPIRPWTVVIQAIIVTAGACAAVATLVVAIAGGRGHNSRPDVSSWLACRWVVFATVRSAPEVTNSGIVIAVPSVPSRLRFLAARTDGNGILPRSSGTFGAQVVKERSVSISSGSSCRMAGTKEVRHGSGNLNTQPVLAREPSRCSTPACRAWRKQSSWRGGSKHEVYCAARACIAAACVRVNGYSESLSLEQDGCDGWTGCR